MNNAFSFFSEWWTRWEPTSRNTSGRPHNTVDSWNSFQTAWTREDTIPKKRKTIGQSSSESSGFTPCCETASLYSLRRR